MTPKCADSQTSDRIYLFIFAFLVLYTLSFLDTFFIIFVEPHSFLLRMPICAFGLIYCRFAHQYDAQTHPTKTVQLTIKIPGRNSDTVGIFGGGCFIFALLCPNTFIFPRLFFLLKVFLPCGCFWGNGISIVLLSFRCDRRHVEGRVVQQKFFLRVCSRYLKLLALSNCFLHFREWLFKENVLLGAFLSKR